MTSHWRLGNVDLERRHSQDARAAPGGDRGRHRRRERALRGGFARLHDRDDQETHRLGDASAAGRVDPVGCQYSVTRPELRQPGSNAIFLDRD